MPAELVLILGAGASVPYGFPTGNELRHWICDLWAYRDRGSAIYDLNINPNPDRPTRIFHALKQLNIRPDDVANLGKMVTESKLPSIDRLVFHRAKEIGHIARSLIAALLLDSESESALQNPRADGDWFSPLWSSLTAGRKSISDVVTDKLAVFTFNYDRSLERLFFSACKATYGVDDKAASEFVSKIYIEHFYGTTTKLYELNGLGAKFDCDRAQLHEAVELAEQEIWLIDDDRKRQATAFEKARTAFGHAKIVTFLGYGFDEINDKNLGLANWMRELRAYRDDRRAALSNAPRVSRLPGGQMTADMTHVPAIRSVPHFQATTLGMYEREVISATNRMSLAVGGESEKISTLSKNYYEALREWGTFDVLR